jgi:uncharacterized protein (TIGR03435 family)
LKLRLASTGSILLTVVSAIAQVPADIPDFEVASVKRAGPSDQEKSAHVPAMFADKIGFEGGPGTKNPERINYHGVSLKGMLARAYNMKLTQITGPGWLDTEHYVVEAIVPPGTTAAQLRLMLQKLLTERFRMTLHRETKTSTVYRMKIAKNGPKLLPGLPPPEYKDDEERRAATRQKTLDNMEAMKAKIASGQRNTRSMGMQNGTTGKFAEMLSPNLDHPVIDMTQLRGTYYFHLEWTADSGLNAELSGPSIFTAIQEQLGLKLEAGQEPFEFLVVDNSEKVPESN